jgi:hypothetical protein
VNGLNPTENLSSYEYTHLFLSFCSFVTLLHTKKLNMANVFIMLLQREDLRDLFKKYCDLQNNFSAVTFFLQFEPGLYKSKYIMKYLNSHTDNLPL